MKTGLLMKWSIFLGGHLRRWLIKVFLLYPNGYFVSDLRAECKMAVSVIDSTSR